VSPLAPGPCSDLNVFEAGCEGVSPPLDLVRGSRTGGRALRLCEQVKDGLRGQRLSSLERDWCRLNLGNDVTLHGEGDAAGRFPDVEVPDGVESACSEFGGGDLRGRFVILSMSPRLMRPSATWTCTRWRKKAVFPSASSRMRLCTSSIAVSYVPMCKAWLTLRLTARFPAWV